MVTFQVAFLVAFLLMCLWLRSMGATEKIVRIRIENGRLPTVDVPPGVRVEVFENGCESPTVFICELDQEA